MSTHPRGRALAAAVVFTGGAVALAAATIGTFGDRGSTYALPAAALLYGAPFLARRAVQERRAHRHRPTET
ncbi:hypothetical protein [Streptomyces sp. TRM68367]|uniref:hypothetical protein n=1 Tax=Streptomyces sp. TRM68367 TaxID=2758415 RepID=UPI00165AFAAE|nr:hypothetical protein [Streptomyces sp. TRM68367]MBC9731220.1 hypothetical protein [Streptomyces sp. TRM68367]